MKKQQRHKRPVKYWHKRPEYHKNYPQKRDRKMMAPPKMMPIPVNSNLPTEVAPYRFGLKPKSIIRDLITGNLMLVRTAKDRESLLDYQDTDQAIMEQRTLINALRRELEETQKVSERYEKSVSLKRSVEGTGEKLIGAVYSINPTNGNRKKSKSKSDEDVTGPP